LLRDWAWSFPVALAGVAVVLRWEDEGTNNHK
jgi:hypothetical protein